MSHSATSPVAILLLFLLADTHCSKGDVKVVGGKPVEPPNKYPWLVQMRLSPLDTPFLAKDAASLKDIKWVTALQNREELDPFSQIVSTAEVVNHSLYEIVHDKNVENILHDIALVRVEPYFIFNQKVAPVNLPACDWDIGNDTQYVGTVAGWGWNQSLGQQRSRRAISYTDVLHEAQFPILSLRTCQRTLGFFEKHGQNRSFIITDYMFCAGDLKQGGLAHCIGDLGGPMMIYNETSLLWTMVGISSNGFGCAEKGLPGIYTKVSKYLEFFLHVTQRCKARVIDGGTGGVMVGGMRGKGKPGGKLGSAIGAGIGAGVIPEY